jgi:hypothetical protein
MDGTTRYASSRRIRARTLHGSAGRPDRRTPKTGFPAFLKDAERGAPNYDTGGPSPHEKHQDISLQHKMQHTTEIAGSIGRTPRGRARSTSEALPSFIERAKPTRPNVARPHFNPFWPVAVDAPRRHSNVDSNVGGAP